MRPAAELLLDVMGTLLSESPAAHRREFGGRLRSSRSPVDGYQNDPSLSRMKVRAQRSFHQPASIRLTGNDGYRSRSTHPTVCQFIRVGWVERSDTHRSRARHSDTY